MKLLNHGKTKNVYELDDQTVRLHFKDDVTGVDGVFDPGANGVGLTIDGIGNLGLQVTTHFFEMLEGIVPSHFITSDLGANTMDVKKCISFGNGLEVICRLFAGGSFIRRYGAYIDAGSPLDSLVEFTLKDDLRNDPPITQDALIALGICDKDNIDLMVEYTKMISKTIASDLEKHGLKLLDVKYEFGLAQGQLVLMDEISAGSMRVSRNDEILDPVTLSNIILENPID